MARIPAALCKAHHPDEQSHRQRSLQRMQTRAELYDTIGYHAYEALDASLIRTVVPEAMPQR
jgi:2-methylisocitrate lyase-like PEP mutase family enzyme